jgi:hypothetical protein
VIVVRYADDIVAGFELESDARRFWDAMRERFEQFGLELHGVKTRLIEFGRFAAANANGVDRVNQKRSRFWDLLSSVASHGAAHFCCVARPGPTE